LSLQEILQREESLQENIGYMDSQVSLACCATIVKMEQCAIISFFILLLLLGDIHNFTQMAIKQLQLGGVRGGVHWKRPTL